MFLFATKITDKNLFKKKLFFISNTYVPAYFFGNDGIPRSETFKSMSLDLLDTYGFNLTDRHFVTSTGVSVPPVKYRRHRSVERM